MTPMRLFIAVLSGALLSSPAWADLLANGSFEAPAGFAQGVQAAVPPDWSATHSSPDLYCSDGSFGLAPGTLGNFTGVMAQQGLGWVAGWSVVIGSFGQQLPTTLAPNAEYAFNGYLIQAKRSDLDHAGAYELLLNSTNSLTGAVVVATLDPTTDSDNWEFVAETFTAPANAGELPWIIFRPYAAGPGGAYPGLDNVSLAPTNVALFDVVQPTAAGPPYPAQAIIADVATRLVPPNPITPVERFKLSLFDAAGSNPPPITPVPMEVSATAPADGAGLDVAFRLSPVDPCASCVDMSAIDLYFELEAHPDSGATPVLAPTCPCVGCNDVNEFDVPFDVFVDGVGTVEHMAHFEINAGQPLVFDNVLVGPPQSPAFHVTFDLLTTEGEVMTAEDLFTVTMTGVTPEPLPGDFDGDLDVDGADLARWKTGFGTPSGATHMQGDADADADVDGADFLAWQRQLGGPPSVAAHAAVPEPNATILCLICASLLLWRWPR